MTLSFYCRFAVNVLGFWLLDTRGLRTLYMVVSTFLAGLYVPVALFPALAAHPGLRDAVPVDPAGADRRVLRPGRRRRARSAPLRCSASGSRLRASRGALLTTRRTPQAGGAGWLAPRLGRRRTAPCSGRASAPSAPTGPSFALDLASSLLVGLTEFAEVWVVFANVTVLGGLDFDAVLLLFGLSNLAFSLADLVVGHVDTLPTYIRAGTLDAFYLRPLPVLAQLVTSDFTLKRLARIGVAAVALAAGLLRNDIDWGPATVAAARDRDSSAGQPSSRGCSCAPPACSSSSSTAPS